MSEEEEEEEEESGIASGVGSIGKTHTGTGILAIREVFFGYVKAKTWSINQLSNT